MWLRLGVGGYGAWQHRRYSTQASTRLTGSRQHVPELIGTWASDAAMHESVAAIAGCGVSPIVRIAANEGWMVKSRSFLDLAGTVSLAS